MHRGLSIRTVGSGEQQIVRRVTMRKERRERMGGAIHTLALAASGGSSKIFIAVRARERPEAGDGGIVTRHRVAVGRKYRSVGRC